MNQVTQAQFGMIPLQFIETDPNQPRRTFDENALQELADSIKVSGVIQPMRMATSALMQLATLCQVDANAIRKKHLDPVLAKPAEAPSLTKQPTRPKKDVQKDTIDPAAAWPFPKSREGA
ncbi:ParB N-terminal domain-containing protein [Herbaspirillum rubrisubalbicans]|nr:ParB N-terminal domain-containing protein [Herbaspirillum rubrisubalbicans]